MGHRGHDPFRPTRLPIPPAPTGGEKVRVPGPTPEKGSCPFFAVVRPADAMMVIVPDGETLVVDAMVLNRDAGAVRAGQAVEIKLEAYPFTRYGVLDGRIERISTDAVEDEKLGLVYPARVRLARSWIAAEGVRRALSPGLMATAEIKTGNRRIIEFLLSPLKRRVQEAGRER